ncbi:MAG: hypothetical protein NTY56_03355, partial [Patescibacteria group bacterium]|nr:hypothetical protein [Patescibacteria group bacterium]
NWDSSTASTDKETTQAKSINDSYIDDRSFFSSFGSSKLSVLDVTDYEGATIIHDMSVPVPNEYQNRYEFIFNGSILDNMFDPAQAMRNISQMLSPSGRVMHIEMATNLAFEYLMFSVDWFLDYYVINNFYDCIVYVCGFKNVEALCKGPWQVYSYSPKSDGTAFSLKSLNLDQAVVVVIAEKQAESTAHKSAVQWCYRNQEMRQSFNKQRQNLNRKRPIFKFSGNENIDRNAFEFEGFLDCGIIES